MNYETLKTIINLIVSYGPTLLFLLIILIAVLIGFTRGYRKSKVLFYNSLIAFIISFTIYEILVNNKMVDTLFVTVTNNILGFDTALQQLLNVSESCKTLKEILVEYIALNVNYVTGLNLIMQDSGVYLLTLVSLAYHLVFAIICYVLYLLIVLILYIGYCLFRNEKKYKKNLYIKQATYEASYYSKSRKKGALLGLLRGTISGLIILSVLGTTLYSIVGRGDGTLEDYDFNDDTYNFVYASYQSVESYGTTGIYKVLNAVKDPNDTPYYLYAMDLVFQGELSNDTVVDDTVYFRDEVANYTLFTKDTVRLLLKYGGSDIRAAILSGDSNAVTDTVVEVISIKGFQEEFKDVINKFDNNSYFINLSFALIDSIMANIDSNAAFSGLSPYALEPLKILFQQGHYSEYIYSEKQMLDLVGGDSEKLKELPYLKPSQLVTRDDVSAALDIFFAIINDMEIYETGDDREVISATKKIVPYLSRLTILNKNNKKEFNPVLGRLYNYFASILLNYGDDSYVVSSYDDSNIDWIGEINDLLDVAYDFYSIWDKVDLVELDVAVFYETLIKDKDNREILNRFVDFLSESSMIAAIMSTSLVGGAIEETLSASFDDFYMPKNLNYGNTYDSNGNLVSHGELFYLLKTLTTLSNAPGSEELIDAIFYGIDDDTNIFAYVDILVAEDENGMSAIDYAVESTLVDAIISNILLAAANEDNAYLFIPYTSLESVDNHEVNMIRKQDLRKFASALKVIDLKVLFDDSLTEEELLANLMSQFVTHKDVITNNYIIESTVINVLINVTHIETSIVVNDTLMQCATTDSLKSYSETNPWHSEIILMLSAIDEVFEIRKGNNFYLDEVEEKLLSTIKNLNADSIVYDGYTKLQTVYSSTLISHTLSKSLVTVLERIIDEDTLNDCLNSNKVIKLNELSSLIAICDIYGVDFLDVDDDAVFSAIARDFDNLTKEITLSDFNGKYAYQTRLELIYGSTIIKYYLTNVLDLVFGERGYGISNLSLNSIKDGNYYDYDEVSGLISAYNYIKGDDYSLNLDNLDARLSDLVDKFDENLIHAAYESKILQLVLTNEIDNIILAYDLVDSKPLNLIKVSRVYTEQEVVYMFAGLQQGLGISLKTMDASSLSFKSIKDLNKPNKYVSGLTSLEVIYRSNVLACAISKLMDESLNEDVVEADVLKSIKENNGSKVLHGYYYSIDEFESLINSINEMGLEDLDSFDISIINKLNDVATTDSSKKKLEILYGCNIIRGVITKMIRDEIIASGSNCLQDNPNAYYRDVHVYKETEIKKLVGIIGSTKLSEFSFADLNLDIILLLYGNNGEQDFSLLTSSISINLISSDLVLPKSEFEYSGTYKILKYKTVYSLLKVLRDAGINDISSFTISNLYLTQSIKTDVVNNSILRATITANMSFSNGITVYSNVDDTEKITDIKNVSILSIKEEEFERLYDAIILLANDGTGKVNCMRIDASLTNLLALTSKERERVLSSNVIRYALSSEVNQKVVANPMLNTLFNLKQVSENVYNLSTKAKLSKVFYTKESIASFISN